MRVKTLAALAIVFGLFLFVSGEALAHCDTMDGPVVKAAQRALATRNVNLVLIWVQKENEAEIKQRFRQTLTVRRIPKARKLADNYFFETVVRLHRAGEKEPYTGLRPAGTDLGPVIPVADTALRDGSDKELLKLFSIRDQTEIQTRFKETFAKKHFNADDVEAGREYVKAYVHFLEYLEHLYEERT